MICVHIQALLTLASWLGVVPPEGANTESIIIHLERQLSQAWVRGDRAFIDNLLDPDWTVTDSTGRILTKHELLEEAFASGTRQVDSMTVDDVKVRVLGSVAIATGRMGTTGSKRGQPVSTVLRFTDIFQLRNGRWQMIASQDTMIAT